jgi:archaellum biogenesis ATPase FlaH
MLEDFLPEFPKTIFQVFNDRDPACSKAMYYTSYNEEGFKKLNRQGFGVYFSPNGFDGRRLKDKLSVINAVYADLDVAKDGDDSTTKQIVEGKIRIVKALLEYFAPAYIIETKNGVQPIWLLENCDVTKENIKLHKRVLKGIIEWSKQFGAKGDNVYDITRVLRLPNYYHMKSKPYRCRAMSYNSDRYELWYLAEAFPYEEEEEVQEYQPKLIQTSYAEIDRIPFQDLVIRAFASENRQASFDKQKRLILDGRLTGTHQGKIGDGDFLASSSHEPYKGNRVTVVADIKKISNKDAFKWIKEEYNLTLTKQIKSKSIEETNEKIEDQEIEPDIFDEDVQVFTWGTERLNNVLTPIQPNQFNVLAGTTGTGKTTFAFDVAIKNAVQGKKILFLTLEMTTKEIYIRTARAYAGITKQEWRNRKDVDPVKKLAFKKRYEELKKIETFYLKGFPQDVQPTLENIFKIIKDVKPDLTFIDNFDLIKKDDSAPEYLEQTRIANELMNYCNYNKNPIILIHHVNSKNPGKGLASLRGSGKTADNSWSTIFVSRNWDVDAGKEENAKLLVRHEKDRDFGQLSSCTVYFNKGTFVDEFPKEVDYTNMGFE